MAVEHEKSTSQSFSSHSTLQLISGGALEEPNQEDSLPASFNQLFNQLRGTESAAENDSQTGDNAILVLTKEGFKFRTAEEKNNAFDDQIMTSMKLFQQLLSALNLSHKNAVPDTTPGNDIIGNECCQHTGESNPRLGGLSVQMTLKTTESRVEHESLAFNSSGNVTTADGQDISFSLETNMQRDFSYTASTEFSQNILFKDPLIINYPGNAAELTDEKYAFDIDADGNEELISYFTNAPMLALDKNEDGIINNGTELFGALSGNGFADLAAFDDDGNNYINEADSIFNDLKLWTKTAEEDTLADLSSMDIGAIYLGASDTTFDLKGDNNQFNGQLKASSFYLTEAGEVGSVQQVDMVV
jgi:hypothetical protein